MLASVLIAFLVVALCVVSIRTYYLKLSHRRLLIEFIKQQRDRVAMASKLGFIWHEAADGASAILYSYDEGVEQHVDLT